VSLARMRAMIVLGILVLLAVVTAGWAIAQDSESPARLADRTPCVKSTVPFASAVPTDPAGVRTNVYNATTRIGLATQVADQLRALGFRVGKVGNDPLGSTVDAPAEIRYGPAGAGTAQMLRAQFPGSVAKLVTRADATVDVVLGMRYESVATAAESARELARLGVPTPPAELC
jgi:hypothetical protein